MRKFCLFLGLLLLTFNTYAQVLSEQEESQNVKKIADFIEIIDKKPVKHNGKLVYDYRVVDKKPEFPGGEEALEMFLKDNLKYPAKSKFMYSQGVVKVGFFVKKDGVITDVEIVRGVHDEELNKEAVRLVNDMPKWIPGKKGRKKVNVYYILPVSFKL